MELKRRPHFVRSTILYLGSDACVLELAWTEHERGRLFGQIRHARGEILRGLLLLGFARGLVSVPRKQAGFLLPLRRFL